MRPFRVAVLTVVLGVIIGSGVPAIADHLTYDDVAASAAALERAFDEWETAEGAYSAALEAHAAAIDKARSIDTEAKLAAAEYRTARESARDHLVVAYTTGEPTTFPIHGDVERAAAASVYRSIVSGRDADTLQDLAAQRESLARVERRRDDLLGPTQAAVEAARAERDESRQKYDDQRDAHLQTVAHWEAQERERLRREEEARRIAEEERLARLAAEEAEAARLREEQVRAARLATLHSPRVERWRPLVQRYFPPELVDEAMAVMACESSGDPKATNPETSAGGLFQHMPSYWKRRAREVGFAGASVYEPEPNVAAAAALALWSRERHFAGTWGYWSCQPDGSIVE